MIRSKGIEPVLLLVLAFVLMAIGMSCGDSGNPASPDQQDNALTPVNERNARTPASVGNHTVWGIYTVLIDQDAKTIEVADNRELAMHLNVRNILQNPWWCPAKNCIQIQFLNIDEPNGLYTIKGTLVNPTYYTGYDVRVIIFLDEKGHKLLNPDDYTMLYEEDTDINPFRAYAKTVPQRKFGSYASFSEIFEMYIPPVPKKFQIDFAIDASFPTNCEEPYDLEEFGYEGEIYPDDPDLDGIDQGEGLIFSKVFDWQNNVTEVTVDLSPITGSIISLTYNPVTDRWEGPVTDALDAAPGDYICLLAAFSEEDPTIGLYNYITVHVDETPPPAVQTIWGKVGDSFTLAGLDGTTVSVVNQDPLGFQPPPTTVVDGEYVVNVTTGIYNLTVVCPDLLHVTQEALNVAVTTDEDVNLDFGLQDPTMIDPHGYDNPSWDSIMGCAGRVVDSTGMPISGATIELTSPDTWEYEGQEFVQAEVTDEGGYFSMTNIVVSDDVGGTITQYEMMVRADGYAESQGLFSAAVNEVPYRVIILTPLTETPVWTEGFEADSGWAFSGFYHRQQWNDIVKNISYDPAYNFCVMPPDELWNGGLPLPTEGQYYLWYGEEVNGNILGPFSSQGQWTGGMSDSLNMGAATSPSIDLTPYSTARLEFDMAFDMESKDPPSFELMYVNINSAPVYFFNPFADPDTDPYSITQRGQNRTVIFCHYAFDISSYTGSSITVGFSFDTYDANFNGFRGEFIDNIKIYAQ